MRGVRTGKSLREGEVALMMAPPLRKHLLNTGVSRGPAPRGLEVQGGFSLSEEVEEVRDGEGEGEGGVTSMGGVGDGEGSDGVGVA